MKLSLKILLGVGAVILFTVIGVAVYWLLPLSEKQAKKLADRYALALERQNWDLLQQDLLFPQMWDSFDYDTDVTPSDDSCVYSVDVESVSSTDDRSTFTVVVRFIISTEEAQETKEIEFYVMKQGFRMGWFPVDPEIEDFAGFVDCAGVTRQETEEDADQEGQEEEDDEDTTESYDLSEALKGLLGYECQNKLVIGEDVTDLNVEEGQTITSGFKITGKIAGGYCSEGDCPMYVLDGAGNVIHQGYITVGNWMTEDLVAFEGTVEFDAIATEAPNGRIIIAKANPSGEVENCGYLDVSVVLGQ